LEEETWLCPGLGQEIVKTALLRTTVDSIEDNGHVRDTEEEYRIKNN
jgi:hypothetical protein